MPLCLSGCRLLILEDDYLIATDLAYMLESNGAKIEGPISSVDAALKLITALQGRLGCALLDIELVRGDSFGLADILCEVGVPIIFVTGRDVRFLPVRYRNTRYCQKPFVTNELLRLIADACCLDLDL